MLARSAGALRTLPRRLVHTEARITELGYTLPSMPSALGLYVPAVRMGNVIHTAGHIPFGDPLCAPPTHRPRPSRAHPLKSTSLRRSDVKSLKVGKVGLDYTTEEGAEMAKIIALELLATLKHELGSPACEGCPWLREAALCGAGSRGWCRLCGAGSASGCGLAVLRVQGLRQAPFDETRRPRPGEADRQGGRIRQLPGRVHAAARGPQRLLRAAGRRLRRARHPRALCRGHQLAASQRARRD